MNFFGKIESRPHRKQTDRNGVEQTIYPFIIRDPNSDQSLALEIFGTDNAKRLADQGFADGAIGTIHIWPTSYISNKDGRAFTSLRPQRWEPAGANAAPVAKPVTQSLTEGMPKKEDLIKQPQEAAQGDGSVDDLPF